MAKRLQCVVILCRRTHRNDEGYGEWICHQHWSLIPRRFKAPFFRAKRAYKRIPSQQNFQRMDRLWRRLKRMAHERIL